MLEKFSILKVSRLFFDPWYELPLTILEKLKFLTDYKSKLSIFYSAQVRRARDVDKVRK